MFISPVTYPVAAGSSECAAHPIAVSSMAARMPPCTIPNGLRWNSAGSRTKETRPGSASTGAMPSVFMAGGTGSVPAPIARSTSSPSRSALASRVGRGSSQP